MATATWTSSEDLLAVECYLETMLDELAPAQSRTSIYALERRHEVDMPQAAAGEIHPSEEDWGGLPPSRNL